MIRRDDGAEKETWEKRLLRIEPKEKLVTWSKSKSFEVPCTARCVWSSTYLAQWTDQLVYCHPDSRCRTRSLTMIEEVRGTIPDERMDQMCWGKVKWDDRHENRSDTWWWLRRKKWRWMSIAAKIYLFSLCQSECRIALMTRRTEVQSAKSTDQCDADWRETVHRYTPESFVKRYSNENKYAGRRRLETNERQSQSIHPRGHRCAKHISRSTRNVSKPHSLISVTLVRLW